MTLLREIQEAATGSDVPLSVLLRKAQVLAVRLDNEPLRSWTRLELDGYARLEDLPDYRRLGRVEVFGHFSGPFNSGLRNAPIPRMNVPEDWQETLFDHNVFESVAELEALSSADESARYLWPADVTALFADRFYEHQGCMQAFKLVPTTAFVRILETVRNRLLDFALSIEQIDALAGDTSTSSTPATTATVTQIFNNTITGGQVAFASSGHGAVQQRIAQHSGAPRSVAEVRTQLLEWGVPEDEADCALRAMHDDAEGVDEEIAVGEQTHAWLGRLATRVAAGSLRLAEGVSIEVVGALLTRATGV